MPARRYWPAIIVALALVALLSAGIFHFHAQPSRFDLAGMSTGSDRVPLRWSGLLLNKDVDIGGKKYDIRCSAQFISPSVVLTAAHCVQDYRTGAWYDPDKMYFLLQYQDGHFADLYRPVCLSRFDGWFPLMDETLSEAEKAQTLRRRYQWDYAMILMDHDSPGGYFNSAVDWNGKYRHATMIGYPYAPLTSQTIQTAFGSLSFVSDRPNVVALAHQDHQGLTEGTSGGAWVSAFGKEMSARENFIVSVSSYVNPGSPGVSFGPYLGSDYNSLFDYVSKGCPR